MDLMKYFFEMVFEDFDSKGKIHIDKLKDLADYSGVGVEGIGGHYDSYDEDYKEGFFTIDFYSPTPFEKIIYIENNVFYEELSSLCIEHMKHKPEDKDDIELYLKKIKNNLHI